MERAGSIPALDTRTGMRPREGLHAARRSFASARSDAVLLSLTPISPVPQRAFQLSMRRHRQGGGEDVCYFGRSAVPLSRSGVAGSNPAGRNAVAECALRSGNSIVCSPPSPSRSVVKIAVTSTVNRAVAGSSPARRKAVRPQGQQQRRSFPAIPITVRGEDRCYFD